MTTETTTEVIDLAKLAGFRARAYNLAEQVEALVENLRPLLEEVQAVRVEVELHNFHTREAVRLHGGFDDNHGHDEAEDGLSHVLDSLSGAWRLFTALATLAGMVDPDNAEVLAASYGQTAEQRFNDQLTKVMRGEPYDGNVPIVGSLSAQNEALAAEHVAAWRAEAFKDVGE